MRKLTVIVLAAAMVMAVAAMAAGKHEGVKHKRPRPHEYGTVILYQSAMLKAAPVQFPHWLHRSKYTCRLCHVDIGFAMVAGETRFTCEDVKNHVYCGVCHNGKESFDREGKGKNGSSNCDRCHSYGKDVKMDNEFYAFKAKFRPERGGNGIDWLNAEEAGVVKLKDYIEGVSIRREKLKLPKDVKLQPTQENMPNILFSHEKHAVWSGCELCHPEIFGVKAGTDKFAMQDNFDNRYCGVCHGTVAFPILDCQRCHTGKAGEQAAK